MAHHSLCKYLSTLNLYLSLQGFLNRILIYAIYYSIFTVDFNVLFSYFRNFEGIVKVGIIGGILLRESISVSKIPKPSEDKSTFSVPLGIPVSMNDGDD